MPAGAFGQGLLKYPVRELADHACLLRERNEGVREQQATGWVAPPDERLDARDHFGPGVDLGLVVEVELVVVEGVGQLAGEREARHAGALEGIPVGTER